MSKQIKYHEVISSRKMNILVYKEGIGDGEMDGDAIYKFLW